jgi:hypothetical protein
VIAEFQAPGVPHGLSARRMTPCVARRTRPSVLQLTPLQQDIASSKFPNHQGPLNATSGGTDPLRQYLRRRFWIEVSLALFTGILALITLLSREWIEVVFHVDPDEGSGSLEWLIVALAAATAVIFAVMARVEWRSADMASRAT